MTAPACNTWVLARGFRSFLCLLPKGHDGKHEDSVWNAALLRAIPRNEEVARLMEEQSTRTTETKEQAND